MYADDPAGAPPAPDAHFYYDEDDLTNEDAVDDCVATEEAAAGQIDLVFENARVPLRPASLTTELMDGMTAREMLEGVDPGILSEWNMNQSPSFGLRVHSGDGDTNIADFDEVPPNCDLQNTIRNTRPGSLALLAPGRATPGSPAVEPGL